MATAQEAARKQNFIDKMLQSGIPYDPAKGDPQSQYMDGIKIKAEGFVNGVDRETDKITEAGKQSEDALAKHDLAAHNYAAGIATELLKKQAGTWYWGDSASKAKLQKMVSDPDLAKTLPGYEDAVAVYEKMHPFKEPVSAVLMANTAKQRLSLMKPLPEYAPFIADHYARQDANQAASPGHDLAAVDALPKDKKMQNPAPAAAAQGPAGTPGGAGTAIAESLARGIPATVLGGVTQKSLAPLWNAASKGPGWIRAAGFAGKYGAPAAAGAAGWYLGDAGVNAVDPNANATWAAHPALSMLGSIASSAAYPLVPAVNRNGSITWPAWMGRPAQAAPAPLGQWQGPTLPAQYVGPGGPGAGPAGYAWTPPAAQRSAYPMPNTVPVQIGQGSPMLALPPSQMSYPSTSPMPSPAAINAMRPVYASPQYMPQPQAQIGWQGQQLALPPPNTTFNIPPSEWMLPPSNVSWDQAVWQSGAPVQ
jgi:hypothetical protein